MACCPVDYCITPPGCYAPATGGFKKLWLVQNCDVTLGYSALAGLAKGQITTFTLATPLILREVQHDLITDGTRMDSAYDATTGTDVVTATIRLDYKDPLTRAKIKRLKGTQVILIGLTDNDEFLVGGDNVKGMRVTAIEDNNGDTNPSAGFFLVTLVQNGRDGIVPLNLSAPLSTDPAVIYTQTLVAVQAMVSCPE
jgi:hypothetical protein